MATSSVVRIGPSDNNVTSLLRNALASAFPQDENASMDETSSKAITISNKYFSANVLLEQLGGDALPQTKEDGVILVFDALDSNPDRPNAGRAGPSFDSLSLAHDQAEEKATCGDLLRLCVGVSLTPLSPEEIRGKNADKEYSRRVLWCLDQGYEYVEADISKEGQTKGHDDRDKEGFARIVEAISGTVWSSAIMSTSKTKELKDGFKEDSKTLELAEEKEPEEEENPYIPPDPSMFQPPQAAAAQPSAEDIGAEELVLDPESVSPDEMAKLREDLETGQVFDRMEGVLKEATRIREASKGGTMTDDERRERAGGAAMALVNLMSQFGLEEDDSVVDDSDDDSGIAD